MGTEVLRPQNLWVERYHHVHQATSFQRRRNFPASGNLTNLIVNKKPYNNNSGQNKKTSPKPDRRKSPEPKNSKSPAAAAAAAAAANANGGSPVRQVTILKRGESLDSLTSKFKGGNPNPNRKSVKSPNRKPVDDLAITGTGRIGPDSPNMVLKQIRLNGPPPPSDMYAGSAFSLSPSPRSLPLPSFFNKKQQGEDLATKDLRRLLRLE